MIQSLKIIKKRIRSIENTIKVTQAMEMISVSKLNNTGNMLDPTLKYYHALEKFFGDLLADAAEISHPLFEDRPQKNNTILCVVTSDTGLCGSYNLNILHKAEEFLKQNTSGKTHLVAIGRKGFNYFKARSMPVLHTYLGMNGRFSEISAKDIVTMLVDAFLTRKADDVYMAYTQFKSGSKYKPTVEKFLCVEREKSSRNDNMIIEPNVEKVLEALVPVYLSCKIKRMLLESFKSEHFSRVIAMRQATDNAKELLEELILLRNKVRQASITKEMLEIVSSAEALKG